MHVIVQPTKAIPSFSSKERWALIQIVEPDLEVYVANCKNLVKPVLYQAFVDLTPAEVKGRFEGFEPYIFSNKHAIGIIKFLDYIKDKADLLVCCCQMGISRSAAVANFAIEFFGCGRESFWLPDYRPNPHVFKTLHTEWENYAKRNLSSHRVKPRP